MSLVTDPNPKEYILCAANYYNDNKQYTFNPKSITEGFIVCGHRHHNCIQMFAQIVGFPYTDEANELHKTEIQGFLTNTNRFVNREEAAQIAFQANQIDKLKDKLFSEDLY
jgi:hypothetical protein